MCQMRCARRRNWRTSAPNRETAIAHALVKSLYDDGRLDEHQVEAFAAAGKFDEANAAIAALANVSVSIAENMMVETRAEGVMILAKVSGMSLDDRESDHQHARRSVGAGSLRSDGLQGHLRTAAALDRAAGAALPPHAAGSAGGLEPEYSRSRQRADRGDQRGRNGVPGRDEQR